MCWLEAAAERSAKLCSQRNAVPDLLWYAIVAWGDVNGDLGLIFM